jgi:hypothetical protein
MKWIKVDDVVRVAIKQAGGDGLYNEDGQCGCGLDDLYPGGCLSEHCLIAKGRRIGDCDPSDVSETVDAWDLGPDDTAWFPVEVKEKS